MKRTKVLLIITAIINIVAAEKACSTGLNDSTFWIKTYHESSLDLVSKAETIFNRVVKASDLSQNINPKLFVIKYPKPIALAIESNAIIISEKALTLCYEKENTANEGDTRHELVNTVNEGDTRLAFIFAHELAHLSNNDFWMTDIFNTIKNKTDKNEIEQVLDYIQKNYRQEVESKADQKALLTIWMTGYDPKTLINDRGKKFFRQWNRDEGTHIKRTETLYRLIKKVCSEVYLFDLGVKLFLCGRYHDALVFFQKFMREEDYRFIESYNNIGLIYYQLAIDQLAECYPDDVFKYKLSTSLETETRASMLENLATKCKNKESSRKYINNAIDNLTKAVNKDPSYISSIINLSSALIFKNRCLVDDEKNYYTAMSHLIEAKNSMNRNKAIEAINNPLNQSKVDNNLAIAQYLNAPHLYEASCFAFQLIITENPNFPDAYFNLAQIYKNENLLNKAKKNWNIFLDKEQLSQYALLAHKNSGITKTVAQVDTHPTQPFKFGDPSTFKQIKNSKLYKERIFDLDDDNEAIQFTNETTSLLFLESSLELIETISSNSNVTSIRDSYGNPKREYQWFSGKTTYIYENFAVEKHNSQIKFLYFKKGNRL